MVKKVKKDHEYICKHENVSFKQFNVAKIMLVCCTSIVVRTKQRFHLHKVESI